MRRIGYQIGSAIGGAAAGVTLVPILEAVYPGTVPYVDTILPGNWAKNEVFYPLVLGGISVGAGVLLDKEYSNFLLGLGITAVTSAILKGALTPGVPARARARLTPQAAAAIRARASRAPQLAQGVSAAEARVGGPRGKQLTPTGQPLNVILS